MSPATTSIEPTSYQSRVLSVPEQYNLFLGGGRGGAKSYGSLLLILRHVEQYRDAARPLLIRESYKAVSELEETRQGLLLAVYGPKGVRMNKSEHTFRLANGAIIECGQLDGPNAYSKFQGRSFTLLLVDEAGLIRDLRWVRLLRSNLRAAAGIPLREILTANPGGVSHAALFKQHVAAAPAWVPYDLDESGETWVNAPSTYRDNPHLDGDSYVRRLRASVGQDEALLRAWVSGDWAIARGAYFGDLFSPDIHLLPTDWKPPWRLRGKGAFVAMDWGSSAPSVVLLCVRAPGDDGLFPAGSLIALDELNTADPRDLNVGLRWPPAKLADAIRERCSDWGMRPVGVGDDAYGLDETLLQVLRREGVFLITPNKGPGTRIAGWQGIRQRLANARDRNGQPGLWITGRCRYLLETLPYLPRDENRPEDIDTTGPDHGADALRYAVQHLSRGRLRQGRVEGLTH